MLDEPIQNIYDCTVHQVQEGPFQKCTVVIRKRDLSDDIIDKQTSLIQKLKQDNTSLKRHLENKMTQITKLKHSFDQLQLNNMQLNEQTLILMKDNQNHSFLQTLNASLKLENLDLKQRIKSYENQLAYYSEVQQKELTKLYIDVENLQNQNSFLRQVNDNYEKKEFQPNKRLQKLQKKCKELQKELLIERKVNQTLVKDAQDKLTASQPLKGSETAVICMEGGFNLIKGSHDFQNTKKVNKERKLMGQNELLLHQSCYSVESIEGNDKSMTYQKSQAEIQTQKCDIYEPMVSRQRLQKSLSTRRNNHMKSVDEHTRLLTLSRELNQKEEQIKQLVKKMEKEKKNSESVKSKLKQKEKQLKKIKKNSIKREIIVVEDDSKNKEEGDHKNNTSSLQLSSAQNKMQRLEEEEMLVENEGPKIEVNQFQIGEQHSQDHIIEIQEESQLKEVILQTEPVLMQENEEQTQWKIYAEHLEGKLFKLQTKANQFQEKKIDQQIYEDHINNLPEIVSSEDISKLKSQVQDLRAKLIEIAQSEPIPFTQVISQVELKEVLTQTDKIQHQIRVFSPVLVEDTEMGESIKQMQLIRLQAMTYTDRLAAFIAQNIDKEQNHQSQEFRQNYHNFGISIPDLKKIVSNVQLYRQTEQERQEQFVCTIQKLREQNEVLLRKVERFQDRFSKDHFAVAPAIAFFSQGQNRQNIGQDYQIRQVRRIQQLNRQIKKEWEQKHSKLQSQARNYEQQENSAIRAIIHDYLDDLVEKCLHQQDGQVTIEESQHKQIQSRIIATNLRTENEELRRLLAHTEELLQNQQKRNSQKGSAAPVVGQAYPVEQMKINFRIMHDEDSETGVQAELAIVRAEVEQLKRQLVDNAEETVLLTEVVTQTEQFAQEDGQKQSILNKNDQIVTQDEVYAYTVALAQKMVEKILEDDIIQVRYKEYEEQQIIIRAMTLNLLKCKDENEQLRKMLTVTEQLLQQEQQEGKKTKVMIESTNQEKIKEDDKHNAIQLMEAFSYTINLADKIAERLANQQFKPLIEGEEVNMVQDFFLPSKAHQLVLASQVDNLFQSNFSLGNLDTQFHLKYQKLLKQMEGLRDENKYLHEMLSLMKSSDQQKSSSENRDMVVSFNIKDSKILQLQHLLAVPLKSSAVDLSSEKDKVRNSTQNIQTLLKVPQVNKAVEYAQIPKLETVSINFQTSQIKQLSHITQQRQKIQSLSEQLLRKEEQIAELKTKLQRVQSKLQKSKKLVKKTREERSRNEEIQIEEEEILLIEVETQTHPQMFDSLDTHQTLEDFCDQLQYRLELESNKNISLKSQIKKYRSTLKKLQSEQNILPANDVTEELEIEEENVQMCEVEVQVNFSSHDISNKKPQDDTVREKMKQTGKLFLNVIENLQQKCMGQDSEENQSENCSDRCKNTRRSVGSNQQERLKKEKHLEVEVVHLCNNINEIFKKYNYKVSHEVKMENFSQELELFIDFIKKDCFMKDVNHTSIKESHRIVSQPLLTQSKVETQVKTSRIDNKMVDLSQLQVLFIESQITKPEHSLSVNPLFISSVAYSPNSSQAFIAAVLKLIPLTTDQIRSMVNVATTSLSYIQVTLAQAEQVDQSTIQQIVKLCGVENIDRLISEI